MTIEAYWAESRHGLHKKINDKSECEGVGKNRVKEVQVLRQIFLIATPNPRHFDQKENRNCFFIKVNARWKIGVVVKASVKWRNLGYFF